MTFSTYRNYSLKWALNIFFVLYFHDPSNLYMKSKSYKMITNSLNHPQKIYKILMKLLLRIIAYLHSATSSMIFYSKHRLYFYELSLFFSSFPVASMKWDKNHYITANIMLTDKLRSSFEQIVNGLLNVKIIIIIFRNK